MGGLKELRLDCFERFVTFLDRTASGRRNEAPHLTTGRRGERAAFFYLRRLGFIITARCWRSPRARGDLDLVAWENDILCFIEVKTRTTRDVKPAEAAVDRDKQRALKAVARDYLRHLAHSCQWRFDVLSVYYESQASQPTFELFQNAFPVE